MLGEAFSEFLKTIYSTCLEEALGSFLKCVQLSGISASLYRATNARERVARWLDDGLTNLITRVRSIISMSKRFSPVERIADFFSLPSRSLFLSPLGGRSAVNRRGQEIVPRRHEQKVNG